MLRYQIAIVDYDAAWPGRFAAEASRLRPVLGSMVLEFEHIGSTSVPGLRGKPIIDIAAAVDSIKNPTHLLELAAQLGYFPIECLANDRIDLWHCPVSEAPAHILHFMEHGSVAWRKPILFRDALRRDSTLREQYGELKAALAGAHGDDIRSYGRAKTDFVEKVVAEAMARSH